MPSPYFKCYPSDFLNGVADLSPNALAVYTICMMRMYDEDGPIPDDPVRIARRCNMRLPTCKKALIELDTDGKIERKNGKISNARVLGETQKRREMGVKQSRNARGTGMTESHVEPEGADNSNEINDHDEPPHSQTTATDEPTRVRSQKLEVRKKDNPSIVPPLEKSIQETPNAKRKRRREPPTPCPDDWEPDEKGREYARKHWAKAGREDLDLANQVEQFRNYHHKNDKWMARWGACWRTWVGNAPTYTPRVRQPNGGGGRGTARSPSEQMSDAGREVIRKRAERRGETVSWGDESRAGGENDIEGDGAVVELFRDGEGRYGEPTNSG